MAFRSKLGVYLFGVALGLLLLGWFQVRKQMAARALQAEQQIDRPDNRTPPAASAPKQSEG